MRGKRYVLVLFLLLVIFFASFPNKEVTPYDDYYSWYLAEIAIPIDQALKNSNKSETVNEYQKTREVFLEALTIAQEYKLPDQKLAKVHHELVDYLEWRVKYVEGLIEFLETKSRDTKALVNNYNDEGNIHYSVFISDLDEYAKKHHRIFIAPAYLY
jgi:hypothetical protein